MALRPEQRLFIRIMRLTLLRGIVVGIVGMLTVLWVYNFIQRFVPWEPVPFSVDGPLGSFYIMLCGAMIVLQWEITRLRSQFLALPRERNGVRNLDNFSKHFIRLIGSFFIVMGFALLIWKPLKFPNPTVSNAQQTSASLFLGILFLGILLSIGGISWYLSLRDKHRAIQSEQEEPRVNETENQMM